MALANDNELANKFAEFFITKIEKIHKSFVNDTHNTPTLTPCIPVLYLTPLPVLNVIIWFICTSLSPQRQKKSRQLFVKMVSNVVFPDPCPDFILKNHLTIIILLWSKLVNLSLKTGSMGWLKTCLWFTFIEKYQF